MNKKKLVILIKISIPLVIIGGCIGINRLFNAKAQNFSQKPVVVCEDSKSLPKTDDKPLEIVSKKSYGNVEGFYENFGFIGDDEAVVGIGLSRDDFYRKYPNKIDKENNEELAKAYNDIRGNMYKLKLSTLEKKPLYIKENSILASIMPNISKIAYVKDDKYNIYDLKNNNNVIYGGEKGKSNSPDSANGRGNWSQDGTSLISYTDSGDLRVYNAKKNSTKEVKVKSDNLWIYSIPSFYSEDGENIYFIGQQPKDKDLIYQRQGLFKVNSSSGKIEEVFVLPYNSTQKGDYNSYSGIPSADYTVLDGGKRILLNVTLEGKDGTYIYDVDSKKFYNVVPHTVKSKEGAYCSQIWVSPDKTKVIYMNRALENGKEQWNLYAAKINENSFTNKICLAADVNLSGALNSCVQWSGDSKKILFFTGKNTIEKNSFVFQDKNEANVITFK